MLKFLINGICSFKFEVGSKNCSNITTLFVGLSSSSANSADLNEPFPNSFVILKIWDLFKKVGGYQL